MATLLIALAIFSKFLHCDCDANSFPTLSKIVDHVADMKLSEDGRRNFTQLVTKYGYSSKRYDVTTEDGYILAVFHIPGGKTPVLLVHGLGDSGDSWVIRGHDSLGINLADAGYDVWVVYNRGTRLSRRHVELDPDTDKKFWDFSFHEMGYYDLAAAIDFVCYQAGKKKILAVGHSQGATQYFSLMSLRPEYNEKVKLFVALAPGVYFYDMPPLFQLFADAGPLISGLLGTLGIEELFKDRGALVDLFRLVCTKGIVSYEVCFQGVFFPIFGFNPSGFEVEFLPTLFGHIPNGTSRKCLVHYDQLYLTKKFRQFDHGTIDNLIKYGNPEPPEYDLSKVTSDVALISGSIDKLGLTKNVELLKSTLPNVVHFEEVAATSHLDFSLGKNAYIYVFPSIFKLLQKYDT